MHFHHFCRYSMKAHVFFRWAMDGDGYWSLRKWSASLLLQLDFADSLLMSVISFLQCVASDFAVALLCRHRASHPAVNSHTERWSSMPNIHSFQISSIDALLFLWGGLQYVYLGSHSSSRSEDDRIHSNWWLQSRSGLNLASSVAMASSCFNLVNESFDNGKVLAA